MDTSEYTDEDVFTGPVTLEEIKRNLFLNYSAMEHAHGITEDANESLQLIETHSAPNIIASCNINVEAAMPVSSPTSSQNLLNAARELNPDDSFLILEKMVTDLNITPNHANIFQETAFVTVNTEINSEDPSIDQNGKNKILKIEEESNTVDSMNTSSLSLYSTPAKNILKFKLEGTTPSPGQKTPMFKTPGNPVSQRKLPRPQGKKAFDHVVSPVASYIKKSPTVPLVTDVKPKRLLSGISCIPKPLKSATKTVTANKENTKLPSVNYKTAKETKVIEMPEKTKLPHSVWSKQVASSIPRALVLRHEHREVIGRKKVLTEQQENSFADLSLHQADFSICIQESAVEMPQHKTSK